MTNEQYYKMIETYKDAERILDTRLDALNRNLYGQEEDGPIHNIQSRIKSKRSIEAKLKRLDFTDSVANAKDNLLDIAGVRVICYFTDDIYNLVSLLKRQPDLILIKEKDYIATPKPNGYRSYHIIVGVPICSIQMIEYYPVEIQLRTLSMDFWASMEHRISYKKERPDKQRLSRELLEYANILEQIECRFERFNEAGRLYDSGYNQKALMDKQNMPM